MPKTTMSDRPTADTILQEALELANSQERTTYLGEVCGSDAALWDEIESLLAAHEAADVFMETLANPVWQETANEKEGDDGRGTARQTFFPESTSNPRLRFPIKHYLSILPHRTHITTTRSLFLVILIGLLPAAAAAAPEPALVPEEVVKNARGAVLSVKQDFEETGTFWYDCAALIDDKGLAVAG